MLLFSANLQSSCTHCGSDLTANRAWHVTVPGAPCRRPDLCTGYLRNDSHWPCFSCRESCAAGTMHKRTYQLRSPKKRSGHAWGSQRSRRSAGAKNGSFPDFHALDEDEKEDSHLMTRAQLVEELSKVDVDAPTLTCCRCCPRGCKRFSRAWLPLFRPTRVTSLFWAEKIMLIVDAMQIYGLLWALSLAWPWPKAWSKWSRYAQFGVVRPDSGTVLTLLSCTL